MTWMLLFEEPQSLGTVQVVPDVRKMTVVVTCDAAGCGCSRKKEITSARNAIAKESGMARMPRICYCCA
jgi:hypothetical protein